MKQERQDKRRVTLKYRHDQSTHKTSLIIDVESADEDLPHEHRRDMREMAEELLGTSLDGLADEIEVRLRPKSHTHPHPHEDERTPEGAPPAAEKVKA
jgi:type IV secretory pathway VirD2 relaxase